jgi:RNA polymerase sigma factor (sigma-70 family)
VYYSVMQAKDDAQLLREYARQGSEASFAALVARYTDLIYSVVLRQAGSPDLAEEVAQSVFTDLARKAPELAAKLGEKGSIVGWLYRGSRFALAKQLRAEQRRHLRERQAMQELDSANNAMPTPTDWARVRPVLDQALAELDEDDRQAMLLRYFHNRGFAAVGAALGVSDDTAQKRVVRALEKLRAQLARQGITTTSALLSAILSTNAIQTAPAGLAARLAGASLAGTAAKTGTTLTLMSLTSSKTALIAGGLAAALAAGLWVEHRSFRVLQEENAALRRQASQPPAPLQPPEPSAPAADDSEKLRRAEVELLRLRGEVGVLRNTVELKQAEVASTQTNLAATQKEKAYYESILQADALRSATVNRLKQIGLASHMFASDNNNTLPTNLAQIEPYLPGSNFPSLVGTNDFELFDYGQPLPLTATNAFLFARETQPRLGPDGTSSRAYLMLDGSVQEARPENGDFGNWESNFVNQWVWRTQRAQPQATSQVSP